MKLNASQHGPDAAELRTPHGYPFHDPNIRIRHLPTRFVYDPVRRRCLKLFECPYFVSPEDKRALAKAMAPQVRDRPAVYYMSAPTATGKSATPLEAYLSELRRTGFVEYLHMAFLNNSDYIFRPWGPIASAPSAAEAQGAWFMLGCVVALLYNRRPPMSFAKFVPVLEAVYAAHVQAPPTEGWATVDAGVLAAGQWACNLPIFAGRGGAVRIPIPSIKEIAGLPPWGPAALLQLLIDRVVVARGGTVNKSQVLVHLDEHVRMTDGEDRVRAALFRKGAMEVFGLVAGVKVVATYLRPPQLAGSESSDFCRRPVPIPCVDVDGMVEEVMTPMAERTMEGRLGTAAEGFKEAARQLQAVMLIGAVKAVAGAEEPGEMGWEERMGSMTKAMQAAVGEVGGRRGGATGRGTRSEAMVVEMRKVAEALSEAAASARNAKKEAGKRAKGGGMAAAVEAMKDRLDEATTAVGRVVQLADAADWADKRPLVLWEGVRAALEQSDEAAKVMVEAAKEMNYGVMGQGDGIGVKNAVERSDGAAKVVVEAATDIRGGGGDLGYGEDQNVTGAWLEAAAMRIAVAARAVVRRMWPLVEWELGWLRRVEGQCRGNRPGERELGEAAKGLANVLRDALGVEERDQVTRRQAAADRFVMACLLSGRMQAVHMALADGKPVEGQKWDVRDRRTGWLSAEWMVRWMIARVDEGLRKKPQVNTRDGRAKMLRMAIASCHLAARAGGIFSTQWRGHVLEGAAAETFLRYFVGQEEAVEAVEGITDADSVVVLQSGDRLLLGVSFMRIMASDVDAASMSDPRMHMFSAGRLLFVSRVEEVAIVGFAAASRVASSDLGAVSRVDTRSRSGPGAVVMTKKGGPSAVGRKGCATAGAGGGKVGSMTVDEHFADELILEAMFAWALGVRGAVGWLSFCDDLLFSTMGGFRSMGEGRLVIPKAGGEGEGEYEAVAWDAEGGHAPKPGVLYMTEKGHFGCDMYFVGERDGAPCLVLIEVTSTAHSAEHEARKQKLKAVIEALATETKPAGVACVGIVLAPNADDGRDARTSVGDDVRIVSGRGARVLLGSLGPMCTWFGE